MLFEEYKCLFFHNGKTAGTAVERWLYGKEPWPPGPPNESNRRILYGWDTEEGLYLHHASALTVRRLAGEEAFWNYYKFSVVRNPYERLISVYHYLFDKYQKQYGDFPGFVRALPRLAQDPQHLRGRHPIPQTRYTHIDGRYICDDIVYFEELPQSLDPIRVRLGITRPFLQRNTYRHKAFPKIPTVEMYDQEMIHIMQDVYATDFEEYSYSIDPSVRERTRTVQLDPQKLSKSEWTRVVVTPRKDTEVSVVDGKTSLLNVFTETRHSLTPVARFIWEALFPENTLSKIQSAICKRYGVAADTARHDLLDLVKQLRKAGLVQVERR